MWEEESKQCQEEEEDQVRDQVQEEDVSPVCPPLILQQTCHHWMPQQVITFVFHLRATQVESIIGNRYSGHGYYSLNVILITN